MTLPVMVLLVLALLAAIWIYSYASLRIAAKDLGLSPHDNGVASVSEAEGIPLLFGGYSKDRVLVSNQSEALYWAYERTGQGNMFSVSVYQCVAEGPDFGAISGGYWSRPTVPNHYLEETCKGVRLFARTKGAVAQLSKDDLLLKVVGNGQLSFQFFEGNLYVFSPGGIRTAKRLREFLDGARMLAEHLLSRYAHEDCRSQGHNHSLQARRP